MSTKPSIKNFAEPLTQDDLEKGILNEKSFCRAQNVFTLEKRLVIKKLGKLKSKKLTKICDKYQGYLKVDQ